MKVWTLGSGSRGNAMVVESAGARLLIDCGFGPRTLTIRMRALGLQPESIAAVLITHEHQDHADGLAKCQHKWRWPVHASDDTLAALRVPARWRRPIVPGAVHDVEGFDVEAVSVPHDAADPQAYVLTGRTTGARVGVAHDLGHVPDALRRAFARCDALCIEANHDVVMLRDGPYPPALQQRIRGGSGHLNNDETGALIGELMHPGLREVVLLHLSESNNTPAVAERSVRRAARRAGFTGPLRAAAGREPMAAFDLDSPARPAIPAADDEADPPAPARPASPRDQLRLAL